MTCNYCSKEFAGVPPSRRTVHYVFRLKTKYGHISGPLHGNCISKLAELQINQPRDFETDGFVLTNGPIAFGRGETVHNGL